MDEMKLFRFRFTSSTKFEDLFSTSSVTFHVETYIDETGRLQHECDAHILVFVENSNFISTCRVSFEWLFRFEHNTSRKKYSTVKELVLNSSLSMFVDESSFKNTLPLGISSAVTVTHRWAM